MSQPFPADPTEHLKLLWREGTACEVQGGKETTKKSTPPPTPVVSVRRS